MRARESTVDSELDRLAGGFAFKLIASSLTEINEMRPRLDTCTSCGSELESALGVSR